MSDIPTLSAMVGETRNELGSLARSLAAIMADPQSKAADRRLPTMNRRMGVVTAVTDLPTFPLRATVEVNGTAIPGCSPQATYRPIVGDLVWLEFLGADPHISAPLMTDANRAWNLITLNSPWVEMNDVGWTLDPAYWRDPLGIVHVIGSVKSGANDTVIGTLPSGFRPPGNSGFAVSTADSGGANATGRVAVLTNGDLLYRGPSTPSHVALDGIHFRID